MNRPVKCDSSYRRRLRLWPTSSGRTPTRRCRPTASTAGRGAGARGVLPDPATPFGDTKQSGLSREAVARASSNISRRSASRQPWDDDAAWRGIRASERPIGVRVGGAEAPGRQIGNVDGKDASAAAAGESAVTSSAVAADSALAPLRIRVFRVLWLAQLGSLIGTWMQTVGAQWLLVDEPAAETLVALVQTANMSPVFFLALPAGVFADVFDRRRLLIVVQASAMLVAGALAALTAAGTVTPAL